MNSRCSYDVLHGRTIKHICSHVIIWQSAECPPSFWLMGKEGGLGFYVAFNLLGHIVMRYEPGAKSLLSTNSTKGFSVAKNEHPSKDRTFV